MLLAQILENCYFNLVTHLLNSIYPENVPYSPPNKIKNIYVLRPHPPLGGRRRPTADDYGATQGPLVVTCHNNHFFPGFDRLRTCLLAVSLYTVMWILHLVFVFSDSELPSFINC